MARNKKPWEKDHIGSGMPSGSAHCRRKVVRDAKFTRLAESQEGDKVKITVADYGKRYKGTTATILEVLKDGYVVRAYRRKAPLQVKLEHVQEAA